MPYDYLYNQRIEELEEKLSQAEAQIKMMESILFKYVGKDGDKEAVAALQKLSEMRKKE